MLGPNILLDDLSQVLIFKSNSSQVTWTTSTGITGLQQQTLKRLWRSQFLKICTAVTITKKMKEWEMIYVIFTTRMLTCGEVTQCLLAMTFP
jgi:hypothetical protein